MVKNKSNCKRHRKYKRTSISYVNGLTEDEKKTNEIMAKRNFSKTEENYPLTN